MAAPSGTHAHRGTICLEDARILSQQSLPGNQFILRIAAPRGAARATPGTFAHLSCDPLIPMRRPLSIMSADAGGGWLEFLYKPVGIGLAQLAGRAPGDTISVLSPIGRGFALDSSRPTVLAIAGGVGIPPVFFLAEHARRDAHFALKVFMGSEVPFPFPLCARKTLLEGLPESASMAVAELDAWSIPSALASNAAIEGSFAGYVTDLARLWLERQPAAERDRIQVVGCGPDAMLRAAADLARSFALPCQLAVEEFMACGVGGCAGCIVPLHKPEGIAMKRVCVDGPVFDARELYPR